MRPADTGWFASFGALEEPQSGKIAYSDDGFRFWGATFDPTPLHRFNAVMGWLRDMGVGVAEVHRHVRSLQRRFIDGLDAAQFGAALPVHELLHDRVVARAVRLGEVAQGLFGEDHATAEGVVGAVALVGLDLAAGSSCLTRIEKYRPAGPAPMLTILKRDSSDVPDVQPA